MSGIYIHIPFCVQKCKYCDFVSFSSCNEYKKQYIKALKNELSDYKGIEADTIFIGGGTPTCLDAHELEYLLKTLSGNFRIADDAEFTIEANPRTVDAEKLAVMKKYGVNRISLGVQSFNDAELEKIGRIHTAEQAIETIELIKSAGFSNLNIDLMSALPSQTFDSFKRTLETAVLQKPEHISCYSLILEEETPLYNEYEKGGLSLPDEDSEREMYEYACRFLKENGYNRYEISNFARQGRESKHNMKYWRCEEYIGAGLSAHSYYKGERFFNTSDLSAYIEGNYRGGDCRKLTLADMVEEYFIMGLRMDEGISRAGFFERFGFWPEQVYKNEISKFVNNGLLIEKDGRIFLSERGISVSNSIMCEFVECNLNNND